MMFLLGMLAGAAAVILGAVVYSVCKMSQIDQYRPGRFNLTGLPVGLIEKYFEGEDKE